MIAEHPNVIAGWVGVSSQLHNAIMCRVYWCALGALRVGLPIAIAVDRQIDRAQISAGACEPTP